MDKYGTNELFPFWGENGVYNFYLKNVQSSSRAADGYGASSFTLRAPMDTGAATNGGGGPGGTPAHFSDAAVRPEGVGSERVAAEPAQPEEPQHGGSALRGTADVDRDGDEAVEVYELRLQRVPEIATEEIVEEHEAQGHLVYRSLCAHCRAALGMMRRHVEVDHGVDSSPTVHSVFYMHDDPKEGQGGFQSTPFLEAVDRWTKCDFALALQNEGSSTTSTVRAFGKFVESLGDRRTTNKSDGEPVIVLLKTNAAGITGIRAVPVGSPVGDHAANGKVENYIRETKGRKRDAERRMHYGRYVGHHNRHGSVMVFTSTGRKVGSSYTRRQDGRGNRQAWQTDGWTELRGLLWDIQPIPPRNTFPVQSRYVEKYGKTIGGDGCIWLVSGVGQRI